MDPKKNDAERRDRELAMLHPLAREVPNIDSAIVEIARLAAELILPKGTIHVISDIHRDDKKLRHVINNASGTLRPLVERLLKDRMPPEKFQAFPTLVFYPGSRHVRNVITQLEHLIGAYRNNDLSQRLTM
jgi:fructose-1,6-bisphosphatase III